MAHAQEPTPEQKAAEFDEAFARSKQEAEQRQFARPAQLPDNPQTGGDAPNESKSGATEGERDERR